MPEQREEYEIEHIKPAWLDVSKNLVAWLYNIIVVIFFNTNI